jgi:spoIIIJ-associated protein
MRIEAEDINEAYAKAVEVFKCSVKDLNIEIEQDSSAGFLGFFKKNAIINVFRKDDKKVLQQDIDIEAVLDEIKLGVKRLMNSSCFDIEVVEVSKYDNKTVFIKLDGEDVALIIGKEGYRYNSLVTILYNWLHLKYNLLVRLEVSEFLAKQEESIEQYLNSLYPFIKEGKRVKTKILDGILLRIALNKIKERYPEKYIRVRKNYEDKKYILVDNRNDK